MALKKVKGNLERMFDKNLTDLVRGIRNNKDNESKYIAQCMEEIKHELRQDNINVKCNAVAKLTYLQMCGYDISWAGFNIIEVMSSNKFTCKRIGYLAASQSFHPDTDILMLTTNMIRKDLNSTNQYDSGVALSGLSCFISTDLSRDLANDIMTLMSSTKPYLRMKAVLMMYKVFLRYPEALRPAFPKLKEKLEDPDPGVQSAAVNVICELARKNPKNYLSLAPIFFKLMTTSTNNWMLIKIIKLFASLTVIEPALGRKLSRPLIELISSTSAMSLLYECINTVIAVLISISSGMPNHSASIQLCVQKLRILIEDSDQNLKYLGLLAMSKILKTHPKSVQSHKDLILACLDDKDESIRLRALDLLYGMVSKKNLMEIVKRLLGHMERAEGAIYRDELLFKIIEICSQGSYQYVTNFEWYLTVLVELTQMETSSKHGKVIATQMLDVTIRVQAVRVFAVNEMSSLLESQAVLTFSGSMFEVLYAAAWIVGEFASALEYPDRVLNTLLKPIPLPGHIQAVYVQNILKIFSNLICKYEKKNNLKGIIHLTEQMLNDIPIYLSSCEIEVQERSSSTIMLLQILNTHLSSDNNYKNSDILTGIEDETIEEKMPLQISELIYEVEMLFDGDLNPVAPKAQRKVQIPDGLDLDEIINALPTESSSSSDEDKLELFAPKHHVTADVQNKFNVPQTKEELVKIKAARMLEQSNNPNYLKSSDKKNERPYMDEDDYNNIPVAEIALEIPLKIQSTKRSDKYLLKESKVVKKKKNTTSKSSKKIKNKLSYNSNTDSESDEPKPMHIVNTKIEMPEGAIMSDSEDKNKQYDLDDPHRALDIDLDIPIMANDLKRGINSSRNDDNQNINIRLEINKSEKPHRAKKNKKTSKENKSDINLLDTTENAAKIDGSKKDKLGKEKIKKKDKKERKTTKLGYENITTPNKELI